MQDVVDGCKQYPMGIIKILDTVMAILFKGCQQATAATMSGFALSLLRSGAADCGRFCQP
jgi:hypothetical protein